MDRWVLSRLTTLEVRVDALMVAYDPTGASRAVMEFVDDDLANWYVRQSRPRLWATDNIFTRDTNAAFATLHEVLVVVTRLLAPFAPFVTDQLHRELVGTSVHLAPYVRANAASPDAALEARMASVRTLATLGRAAREQGVHPFRGAARSRAAPSVRRRAARSRER